MWPLPECAPCSARACAHVTWGPSALGPGDSESDAAPWSSDYPACGYFGFDRSWFLIQSVDYSLRY